MSRCRSCGAAITWARSEDGRAMPIDKDPVAGGNLVVENGVARVAAPDLFDQRPRHVSHFATCPQAKEHRRSRGKR